ncbi:MAG: conjugal transfer protein TraX [Rickettsia endosymbiont of Stiretrus anchorago]|nr:conjugal transfer protein TraX [Rickettsia endosymbiont of Stiretrus anchorago]
MLESSKNKSNYQDLLKTLAIIAMIIDHIGLYLYPDLIILRIIGRTAMPVFCFFAGYNFYDKPKLRVIIWGILLQIYTTILFKQFITTNILISIYLGQCYIYCFRKSLTRFFYSGYCHVIIMIILWYISWAIIDYGTIVIAIMILGFIAKHEPKNLKLCCFVTILITLVHSALFMLTIAFSDLNFSNFDLVLDIILLTAIYILMIISNYSKRIFINLKWISRNVIYIYCVQIMILQFIFVYSYTYGFKNW